MLPGQYCKPRSELLRDIRLGLFDYPHSRRIERAILASWIESYGPDGVYCFDVRLPTRLDCPGHYTLEECKMVRELTALRIDLVVLEDGNAWLCEVKPEVRHHALGQLMTYEALFRAHYDWTGKIVYCHIAAADRPVIRALLERLGVRVFIVRPMAQYLIR